MMLIPTQTLNFAPANEKLVEHNDYSSPGLVSPLATSYFSNTNTVHPTSTQARLACANPPVEERMFATKMQSDIPGFNMYAAAAAATGQPGSSALNSPANYAVAAAGAPAPTRGLVPTHYGHGMETTPYYTSLATAYDMKNADLWSAGYGQTAPAYYQYESGFPPQYPYERYCGMDMNDGVRRKNATRESTNTLKAWLQEHKKNPYPTKGEKIMLAIITKMTLTQVSTWFANARRRLKKENKMTWIPKNRANESGSGTEDRRGSDDKDTDEKTEDGDCKSETGENDPVSPDLKSDAEIESYQYSQEKHVSLPYCREEHNNADPVLPKVSNTLEPQKNQPDVGYPQVMSRALCEDTSTLHNANSNITTLQERARNLNIIPNAPQHRLSTVIEGNQRSIWSPIDRHSQQNMQYVHRTYNYPCDTDPQYQGREMYQGEGVMYDQHMPMANQQQYSPHTLMQPFLRQTNSQECHPSEYRMHTSGSYDSIRDRPYLPFSVESQNKSNTTPNVTMDSANGALGRSNCRFTSPVTNLQNWVKGVFHAPCPTNRNSPLASTCGKNSILSKSPNAHTDSSSRHSLSPPGQVPYREQLFSQRNINPIEIPKNPNLVDELIHEPYALQHHTMPVPYNPAGYYSRTAILGGEHQNSKQEIIDTNSHRDSHCAYPSDSNIQTSPARTRPNCTDDTPIYSSEKEMKGAFQYMDNSVPGASGNVQTAESPKTFLTSPMPCQGLPCQMENMPPSDVHNNNVPNSQIMPYYGKTSSHSLPSIRSNGPPPPYAQQCQFSNSPAVVSAPNNYMGSDPNSECSLNRNLENANQSEVVPSTTLPQADSSTQENCNFDCKISPRHDKGKRVEMQAAEALTNLSGR